MSPISTKNVSTKCSLKTWEIAAECILEEEEFLQLLALANRWRDVARDLVRRKINYVLTLLHILKTSSVKFPSSIGMEPNRFLDLSILLH
jgi:hypothetical protein